MEVGLGSDFISTVGIVTLTYASGFRSPSSSITSNWD
jgi:hypothetical protein